MVARNAVMRNTKSVIMPRVRTRARANDTIVLSSDEEDDAPRTARPRRAKKSFKRAAAASPPVASTSRGLPATRKLGGGGKGARSPSSDISPDNRAGKRRKTEEVKSVEVDLCSPSQCTRSSRRLSDAAPSPKLSAEERCKAEIQELALRFGEDDGGLGVKVVANTDVPGTIAYVAVSPQCSTRSFSVMLVARQGAEEIKKLKFAPPLRVRIEVSATATRFTVVAPWLLKTHLKRLSKEMNKIYRTDGSSAPLTAAIDWLEANGLEESGTMFSRTLYYAAPDVARKEHFHIVFQDLQMIRKMFLASKEIHENISKAPGLRGKAAFDCAICYEHKPVMSVVIFPGCTHQSYFCATCVRRDFSLKVKENRLGELTCLADQCLVAAPQEMVKNMLDATTFQQFCDFSAEKLIGGPSYTRCPRKECSAPMELDADADLEVQCLTCSHKFCSSCKAKPHPKKPCLTDDQKREIRNQYKSGDARVKKELELRYGVDNIKFAMDDAESETWVAKNTKPCPKCKTNIEKLDGCNHMTCSAKGCKASFCWLCGVELSRTDPYGHFQAVGACSGRLHEGQNLDALNNLPFHGYMNAMINWDEDFSGSSSDSDSDTDDNDEFNFWGGGMPPLHFLDSDSGDEDAVLFNHWMADFDYPVGVQNDFELGDGFGLDFDESSEFSSSSSSSEIDTDADSDLEVVEE